MSERTVELRIRNVPVSVRRQLRNMAEDAGQTYAELLTAILAEAGLTNRGRNGMNGPGTVRPLIHNEPFDPERSPFNRQMAAGHEMRRGHKLTGHYVSSGAPGVVKLVRTCCPITNDVTE